MKDLPELSPEVEAAIRKHVSSRCRLWCVLFGIPALMVFLTGLAMLWQALRLRAELPNPASAPSGDVVRFGMPLEIHNPAWGTVIDGVDPSRFPSSDPADGRRGARLHQFVPLSNAAQVWELRPHQASQ
jgi:hypothetical protein